MTKGVTQENINSFARRYGFGIFYNHGIKAFFAAKTDEQNGVVLGTRVYFSPAITKLRELSFEQWEDRIIKISKEVNK